MWLAYKSWIASDSLSDDDKQTAKQNEISSWAALRSGFFTNLLNVKCSLYFLGLFTTLIRPGTPIWQVAMLCILMFIITVIWFTLVALIFTNVRIRKVYLLRQVWINRTLAVFLTVLAIKVIVG
jgi:threonine/homoserine/homoserine lactone efflux protein